ncbi:hypothetical protein AWR36_014400 [Microbulbifer flavimaris]|uniref:Uncharacterized protein n=1 Tax=Microbulbifer flavimaris TaxID=1781068 RepID=A0ABX4HWG4_9GAMM|nr:MULTISPECIES: hypothetical protein [Microbulbifer]KUJ80201.1 hypothetical protein AVO43_14355 [Microbulbifer sp. ZGT114]PCO04266.1 hypothetical protein AWR36_014400 [Microbulbifer flavimaris]
MQKTVKRGIAASCLLAFAVNLTACGYFLYPERKGQTGGRVDPVVVVLDGAALLFGILPGIVAFAVDFTNGTIYLPAGGTSAIDRHLSATDEEDVRTVVDQEGQVWVEMPLEEGIAKAEQLRQLSNTLSGATGQRVAPADIVWVEDLAALRAASARATAAL